MGGARFPFFYLYRFYDEIDTYQVYLRLDAVTLSYF